MQYPTNLTRKGKPSGRASPWLARLIQALGARLFAANDREAAQHGWQITHVQCGLGRSYRDPRFDTLTACPRCRGSGTAGRDPCNPCGGTGRTTRAALAQGENP